MKTPVGTTLLFCCFLLSFQTEKLQHKNIIYPQFTGTWKLVQRYGGFAGANNTIDTTKKNTAMFNEKGLCQIVTDNTGSVTGYNIRYIAETNRYLLTVYKQYHNDLPRQSWIKVEKDTLYINSADRANITNMYIRQ